MAGICCDWLSLYSDWLMPEQLTGSVVKYFLLSCLFGYICVPLLFLPSLPFPFLPSSLIMKYAGNVFFFGRFSAF